MPDSPPSPPVPWARVFASLRRLLDGERLPAVSQVAAEAAEADAVDGAGTAAAKGRTPFAVLVSTMISLRTKDDVTAAASGRLLERAPDAASLAALPEERIAGLIFPAGFYRTKARHLRRTAALLVERHDGRVPRSMEELLQLPGVGRKTANLVRNLGWGLDGICVDTHVHRIANRLGWVRTATPAQTEAALEKVLPRRYWIPVNELLVGFGQRLCTPVSPRCSACPISWHCRRVGVVRSR